MSLIDRCLCGADAAEMESFARGDVVVRRCSCRLEHLVSELSPAQYLEQFGARYHTEAERRSKIVVGGAPMAYANRYTHDYHVAQKRLDRYCHVLAKPVASITSALDVGCANAAFVDYLCDRRIWARGVEIDATMARSRVLIGTVAGLLDDGLLSRGFYDLVTYHDVLEHTLDPVAEVRAAAELVSATGALVIDVPDVSTPEGAHHYKPEHVWYFSRAALAKMLHDAGLASVHIDVPIPGKVVAYGRR